MSDGGGKGSGDDPAVGAHSWDQPIDMAAPRQDAASQWWPAGHQLVDPTEHAKQEASVARFRQRRTRSRVKWGLLVASGVSFAGALVAGILTEPQPLPAWEPQNASRPSHPVTLVLIVVGIALLAAFLIVRRLWREVHEMSRDFVKEYYSDVSILRRRRDYQQGKRGIWFGFGRQAELQAADEIDFERLADTDHPGD